MHFILPKNTLVELSFIRQKYQDQKKINLDEQPSIIGRPLFWGGTDVITRRRQIEFLEKMKTVLSPNLLKEEEEIKTPEAWQANLTASRVMIASCLYVQSQISSKENSVLYRLIDADLGISPQNSLDREDKEICFLAAKRLITSSLSAFDDANVALRKAGLHPFSELEWEDFTNFLCTMSIKKVTENPYANYPITSITAPLFGSIGGFTGAAVGLLSGDVVSRSSKSLATKYHVTAFVGSSLLVLGSAGPTGIALIAPAIAERLISSFCSLSLAHILSVSMKLVGQGIGVGVGIPLDMAYRLLWSACTIIASYGRQPKNSLITGTRIGDGMTSINGIIIEITPEDKLPQGYAQQVVEIRDGALYINDKPVEVPDAGVKLPQQVIDDLKARLEQHNKKETSITPALEEVKTDETKAAEASTI